MNSPQVAHLGHSKEVHGADEYDPLGYYVTFDKEIRYHMEEGHTNFLEHQHKALNELAIIARATDSVTDKAAAWDYFMTSNTSYWLGMWKRFEGENRE